MQSLCQGGSGWRYQRGETLAVPRLNDARWRDLEITVAERDHDIFFLFFLRSKETNGYLYRSDLCTYEKSLCSKMKLVHPK